MTLPLERATAYVKSVAGDFSPVASIILGSGLGDIVREISDSISIPFGAIPGFEQSTASGHAGTLVLGRLADRPVVVMAGRLHRYEGWTFEQVTFPVRVLAECGSDVLIVSNAAGGLRHYFNVAEAMVIRDHINFLPLRGSRQDFQVRGPNPYDPELARRAIAIGRAADIPIHQGTYLATLGPSYETRAEYRMMRRLGADAVGMSTVPEVLVAQRCGMKVLALSIISNVATPDAPSKTTHQEVLDAGLLAAPRMSRIVRDLVKDL